MTPTNLLVASMAAEPPLPHTCKALVELETWSYHATAHSVRSGRPDALPTELSQLDYHVFVLISKEVTNIRAKLSPLDRKSKIFYVVDHSAKNI